MGITMGIIGAVATAGSTAATVINSNKQADKAEAQAKSNQDQQTKLYNDEQQQQEQQQKDAQGSANSKSVRDQSSQLAADNSKRAGGVQSTVLTSPLGIPDSENSSLQKKTLLGM
jgi:type II secretory pathway pseudopilin PulG